MLEIKDVYKTFNAGTVNEKRAINGLNLNLSPGDFVTVIGGNGAGKSTMLNLIAGVFPPDGGLIRLNGFNLTKLPEHRRARFLGRVFQDPMMGTAASMGIEENLALAYRRGQSRGLGKGITQAERKLYREKLAMLGLGLEDRMTSKVGLLSGGQRQALTLLMATLKKPVLLLLDEHTAALDPKTAAKVLDTTEKIVQAVAPTKREEMPPLKVTMLEEDLRPFFPDKRTTIPDVKQGILEGLKLRQTVMERQKAKAAAGKTVKKAETPTR